MNRVKDCYDCPYIKEKMRKKKIEIPKFMSRSTISQTINGYLKQSKKERIIIVKHANKCYLYN